MSNYLIQSRMYISFLLCHGELYLGLVPARLLSFIQHDQSGTNAQIITGPKCSGEVKHIKPMTGTQLGLLQEGPKVCGYCYILSGPDGIQLCSLHIAKQFLILSIAMSRPRAMHLPKLAQLTVERAV